MSYKIYGRVKSREDNRPLANIRVTAWDFDKTNPHDKIGRDFTDSSGHYVIEYDKKYWDTKPGTTPVAPRDYPDVYVVAESKDKAGHWFARGKSSTHSNHNPSNDLRIDLSLEDLPCPYVTFEVKNLSDHSIPTNYEDLPGFKVEGSASASHIDQSGFASVVRPGTLMRVTMVAEIKVDGGSTRQHVLRSEDIPPDLGSIQSVHATRPYPIVSGAKRYTHRIVLSIRVSTANGGTEIWRWRSEWLNTTWSIQYFGLEQIDGVWSVPSAAESAPNAVPSDENIAMFLEASPNDTFYITGARGLWLHVKKENGPGYWELTGVNMLPVFDPPLLAEPGLPSPFGKIPERTVVRAGFRNAAVDYWKAPTMAFFSVARNQIEDPMRIYRLVLNAPSRVTPENDLKIRDLGHNHVLASSSNPYTSVGLGKPAATNSKTLEVTNDTGHDVRFKAFDLAWCPSEADAEVLQMKDSTIAIQRRWPGDPFKLGQGQKMTVDITGGAVAPCGAVLAIVPYSEDVPGSDLILIYIQNLGEPGT